MEPDNNPLHVLLSVAAIQHELDKRRVQRKHLRQPKQQLPSLLSSKGIAVATWIGYGGARGGGKSGAIRRCAVTLATQEPGITIWIFRRVFGDLKKDHVDKFREEFPHF